MDASNDILRKALRRSECRWIDCHIVLSSFELLEKHYAKVHVVGTTVKNRSRLTYQCQVKPTKAKMCGWTSNTSEELIEHIMKTHHQTQMWICPIPSCRTNLRRFKTDEDLQDHLDIHLTPGSTLPQAVPIPVALTALPPVPKSTQLAHEFLRTYYSPAAFKKNRLVKAKENALKLTAIDPTRAVSFHSQAWADEEEDNSPAETKWRKTRVSKGAATRSMRRQEALFWPPRFLGAVPRAPVVSVGFDSIGFRTLAREAFEIVAAQSSDEETELGSPTAMLEPSSDVELDSEF